MALLPDIPAEQIARDAEQSYDSQTGILTVTAQTFDPFEQDSTLAGTAALRLGPGAVPLNGNGTPTSGGAFLDLTMIYTRPSNDTYDIRGFDRAVYISGEPISRIRQDIRTLDCASNTTEVIYEDNYYDYHAPYGLLAGLYLALPRYRGHRGYWSGQSYRRPHRGWSQWRKRARDYGYRGQGYDRLEYDRSADGRSRDERRYQRRQSDRRRGPEVGSGEGNGPGGRRAQNRRRTLHSGDNITLGGSRAHREYIDRRGVDVGRANDGARSAPARVQSNTARNARNAARDGTASNREDRVRGPRNRGAGNRDPRSRGARDGRNTRRAGTAAGVSTPAPIARQPAPRPIARTAPPAAARPAPVSRPAPPRANPPREARRETPRTSRRDNPRSKRSDRAIDRGFKRSSRKSRKHLNFFPALGGYQHRQNSYAAVQTDYRCVREESVTLHIPQERLDAARFDGMTLVLVDNADRDVAVYIPPNYIEGFRQAARRNGSGGNYYAPNNSYGNSHAPQYQPQTAPLTSTPPAAYPQN